MVYVLIVVNIICIVVNAVSLESAAEPLRIRKDIRRTNSASAVAALGCYNPRVTVGHPSI